MSTHLHIYAHTSKQLEANDESELADDILLNTKFLYEVIVNDDFLSKFLNKDEIKTIRPDWGIEYLKPTSSLTAEKREIYLSLLKEVMKTNSPKNLNKFLYEHGLESDKLIDRVKSAEEVLKVMEKIKQEISSNNTFSDFIWNELERMMAFLRKRIELGEKVSMEYED
ncbi:MAG: hypothetical protein AAF696_06845 [Bacteroidota bacterium]